MNRTSSANPADQKHSRPHTHALLTLALALSLSACSTVSVKTDSNQVTKESLRSAQMLGKLVTTPVSLLGNVAPEPETFTLEPGTSQTLEPMRAGFRENLTELHLTLRLRTVEANETQTLVLKAP